MGWKFYNPNPSGNYVGDCVIRALALATGRDWESTYLSVVMQGYDMHDMPASNAVWGAFLKSHGWKRYIIPNECPDCYTIKNFAADNPEGLYILATGSHVVTVKDGFYYDTWDSGNEIPIYFWKREEI